MSHRLVRCKCGRPKYNHAKLCTGCAKTGRKPDPNAAYALELGISLERLKGIGVERLRLMTPEARRLVLKTGRQQWK